MALVGFSNVYEEALLALLFTNTDVAGIGDAGGLRGSVEAGSLYLALYTADPDEGGSANLTEASFTGYARVGVARNGTQWTISQDGGTGKGKAVNTSTISFGQNTGAQQTLSHWAVVEGASGAGDIILGAPLRDVNNIIATIPVATGATAQFGAGQLSTLLE
jgi:hypothetical protein